MPISSAAGSSFTESPVAGEPTRSGATAATGTPAASGEILLELVDEAGVTIGTAEKLSAHQAPGQLHRAFSVFLFDTGGRLLMQRRALGKYHSPGVWSNTCCGHPYPGEQPFVAAARRTAEELGLAPALLREAGTVRYNHPDPASGLVEQEFNHLFVGVVTATPAPDPDEVADTRFVTPAQLADLDGSTTLSAWFYTVLDAARPAARELVGDSAGW
ncbi:isopentenyl-diphosphate Delta-isomerase [Streptomyces sp. SL13]|uniref:Isopentenyl-diphosphate Delta-isomerase n=1 Tax=Streptantibioticus silvisoli TaxID=2705255 RepID=A0AA90H9B8_9ACTN|nr:isopentenyl-diphosphate Delta-isomerase [Streptantibioticus silvisoli]MDI5974241.1 isopentenyl-diphosphate Delta-isomerase [Streptantibioticus silvisoli]